MEDFKDNDWGESVSQYEARQRNKKMLGIGGLALATCLYFGLRTDVPTADEVRLSILKKDYDYALEQIADIDKEYGIESSPAILLLKSSIYLEGDSEYYDMRKGYSYLKQYFEYEPRVAEAIVLLDLVDRLSLHVTEKEQYLMFLSNNGDEVAKGQLVDLYLSSSDSGDHREAYKLLLGMPVSTERNIKLSDYLIYIKGGSAALGEAHDLLLSAAALGSPEAQMKLAFLIVEQRKTSKSKKKVNLDNFPKIVTKAIDMGYSDKKNLSEVARLLETGRFGVPVDAVLAQRIRNKVKELENE
ncbi:TPA: hypothetical protein I7730_14340 [Vibrio vulnificus]|uniref:Uncharacterized protein n=1 Tax=Vibrio vulnificus TaxID=672 RepID=A0A8H9N180_VIBVL|nr:hypothetical protein [Vibrio vulnificus]HAS8540966.1 hypothetical protein [Vibrio vulnificus]